MPLTEVPEPLAKKLPRYPTVPAVLIGWLGRHSDYAGQGLGEALLFDAIKTVATAPIGAHAIFADAIDDQGGGILCGLRLRAFGSSGPHALSAGGDGAEPDIAMTALLRPYAVSAPRQLHAQFFCAKVGGIFQSKKKPILSAHQRDDSRRNGQTSQRTPPDRIGAT